MSSLLFIAFFASHRSPLSERLEQAIDHFRLGAENETSELQKRKSAKSEAGPTGYRESSNLVATLHL